jgi:hypothetical protein
MSDNLPILDFDTYQISSFRTTGLTAAESSAVEAAHEFFGLPHPPTGNSPIAEVIIFPDGRWGMFRSDRLGRSFVSRPQLFPKGLGSGIHGFSLNHAEGSPLVNWRTINQAAEQAGELGVSEAVILSPKGACTCCDPSIPQMMPRGTRLFYIDPWATTIYKSSSGVTTIEGIQFARPFQRSLAMGAEESAEMYIGMPEGGPGISLLLFLQPLIDAARNDEDQFDLKQKRKLLELQVQMALAPSLEAALEIQYRGRGLGSKPKADVEIEVSKTQVYDIVTNQVSRVSYQFRLMSARVSTDSFNSGPPTQPNWSPRGIFGGSSTAVWQEEHTYDWPLPSQWVEVYSQFREQMLWFDDAALNLNVSAEELMRLNQERFWIQTRFADLLNAWIGITATAVPKVPYNPVPAPGAFPQGPPPPLPPFVRRRTVEHAPQTTQGNGAGLPKGANAPTVGTNASPGSRGIPPTAGRPGILTVESNATYSRGGDMRLERRESVTKTYKVAPGECLSVIARRVYGDASRWQAIAAANNIRPPAYTIQVGQILIIP